MRQNQSVEVSCSCENIHISRGTPAVRVRRQVDKASVCPIVVMVTGDRGRFMLMLE